MKYAEKIQKKRAGTYASIQPIRLLIDECVAPDTAQHLKESRFSLMKWCEIGSRNAPDETIYAYAVKMGFVVVTHDHDFQSPTRFDLTATHGTIILPQYYPRLGKAIQYFTHSMSHSRDYWSGRTIVYQPSGNIVSLTPRTPEDLEKIKTDYDRFAVVIGRYAEIERPETRCATPPTPHSTRALAQLIERHDL